MPTMCHKASNQELNMFPWFLNSSDLTEDLYSYHSVTHQSQHFM